jgi:hypothetical protein
LVRCPSRAANDPSHARLTDHTMMPIMTPIQDVVAVCDDAP